MTKKWQFDGPKKTLSSRTNKSKKVVSPKKWKKPSFFSRFKKKRNVETEGTSNKDEEMGAAYILAKNGTASTRDLKSQHSYDTEEDFQSRMQDFVYAQDKRRESYGDSSPWGILGLYEHLAGIRTDIEWADDVAWRKVNGLK